LGYDAPLQNLWPFEKKKMKANFGPLIRPHFWAKAASNSDADLLLFDPCKPDFRVTQR
jgi:hypothetical protein